MHCMAATAAGCEFPNTYHGMIEDLGWVLLDSPHQTMYNKKDSGCMYHIMMTGYYGHLHVDQGLNPASCQSILAQFKRIIKNLQKMHRLHNACIDNYSKTQDMVLV